MTRQGMSAGLVFGGLDPSAGRGGWGRLSEWDRLVGMCPHPQILIRSALRCAEGLQRQEAIPLDESGEFYLDHFGDFAIDCDSLCWCLPGVAGGVSRFAHAGD